MRIVSAKLENAVSDMIVHSKSRSFGKWNFPILRRGSTAIVAIVTAAVALLLSLLIKLTARVTALAQYAYCSFLITQSQCVNNYVDHCQTLKSFKCPGLELKIFGYKAKS
jgi:hypothetical protein